MDIWTDPAILTIILSIGIIVGTVICISKKYKLKGFSIAAMVISILCLMSGLFQANRIGLFNKPTEESFSLTESSKKGGEDIHNTGRDYKKDSEKYLPSAKEKQDAQSDVSKKKSSGVDPDLKAFLDSYEDFVDEYVVFMKKYSSDPNNVASMLGEYSEIMARYADFAEKIDEYDSKTMSTEDAKYYIEVTSRCSQKMLDIYGK